MKHTELDAGDFSATYGHTWLRMKSPETEGLEPIYVQEIRDGDGGKPVVIGFAAIQKKHIEVSVYGPNTEVEFTYPTLGCVNYHGVVAYNERSMSRQFRRGLRSNMVSTKLHGRQMMEYAEDRGFEWDFNRGGHIKRLFSPVYPSMQECIEKVGSAECYASAFSKNFLVVAHPDYKVLMLGYKRLLVGVLDGESFTLSNACTHLQPQLNKVLGVSYYDD